MNLSEQRKNAQVNGDAPEWMSTGSYQVFVNKYAAYAGETIKQRFEAIAKHMAKYAPTEFPSWWEGGWTKGKSWENVFFDLMWAGVVVPPTPLYANGGVPERGMTVSCSGGALSDNLCSRYDSITELAVLTKHAAGTSIDLSAWPCEGQALKRGGRSSGIVPIINNIVSAMDEVTQANRRGSCAYSLNVRHGDFRKVLEKLYAEPESNNVGWLYDDQEIQDVFVKKDPEAVARFAATLSVKMPRGKGYYTKISHMNRHLAKPFKELGMSVKASNLCVAPETLVLTRDGYVPIKSLAGGRKEVWNGEQWSEAAFALTGKDQALVKVSFSNGMSLDCTPYHRFEVVCPSGVVVKTANELLVGDALPRLALPTIDGCLESDTAYVDGFFAADGDVPDCKYTIKSRLDWLAGLLDVGVVFCATGGYMITSLNKEFLEKVLLMLQTLGVYSRIAANGNGSYVLHVSSDGFDILISLGLDVIQRLGGSCDKTQCVTVVSVEDHGRISDTYCFNEPLKHRGFFNGINALNCQEIVLPADDEHTYSCVLLNYNLHKWDSWPEHSVFIGQVMSDCNVSAYLEALETCSDSDKKVLHKIQRFTKKYRALGSGVMGLTSLFQKRRIVWGSLDSFYLNKKVFRHLDEQSLAASQWLAGVMGEPEGCVGLGIRNATRLSMPPTKSTSELCYGVSEGINPDVAHVFTKQTAAGEIIRISPELLELMKERGVDLDAESKRINDARGSVQGVDWLSDHEKAVFRVAFEVDMFGVLRLAEQRQEHIDQAQSLNLYFSGDADPQYIVDVHKEFFLSDKLLSLYYIYSSRGGDFAPPEACEVCQ